MPIKPISKNLIRKSTFWIDEKCKGESISSNSWFDISGKKDDFAKQNPHVIDKDILRCKKVYLKPSQKQRFILKTWMEIYRQTYNMTVKYLKKHKSQHKFGIQPIIREKIDKNDYLRALIKKSKIPIHTVNNAIFDVIKAYDTGFTNLRNGNITHFRLRYKKLSKPTQTLVLEPQVFNKNGTGFRSKDLVNLSPSSHIETKKNVRCQFDTLTKKFTLFIPEIRGGHHVYRMNRCALDPGIRTFQSAYSDNKAFYQFATAETSGKLKQIVEKIHKTPNEKKKYLDRLRRKLRNKVADLHWKTAKFLCTNFDNILIGNMSTKSIIKKGGIMTPANKRLCVALSHFTFRDRLQTKCEEYGANFRLVDESYSTMTCGKCGELYREVGGAKTFICPQANCDYSMPRDYHGARNILIKNT